MNPPPCQTVFRWFSMFPWFVLTCASRGPLRLASAEPWREETLFFSTRWPAAARLKRGSRAKKRGPSPNGEGPCHSRKARALEDRALLERSKKLSCRGARASVLTPEYTGSLPTSEGKRRRARLVLGWRTAREDLRVLPALLALPHCATGTPHYGDPAGPRAR